MKLNEIKDNKGAHKARMRVGRGIGSGKGKTCGRGGKGQTARSGVAVNGFEGGQMPLYMRLPKRGFTHIFKKEFAQINVGTLQQAIDDKRIDVSKEITAETLVSAGLIKHVYAGIRLLGNGLLKSKVSIRVMAATKTAKESVEKAGGTLAIDAKTPCLCKPEQSEKSKKYAVKSEKKATALSDKKIQK